MADMFLVNIDRQMDDLREGCVEKRALPMVLIAIDENKKGHLMWPDDLPDEILLATPLMLQDALDELRLKPINLSEVSA